MTLKQGMKTIGKNMITDIAHSGHNFKKVVKINVWFSFLQNVGKKSEPPINFFVDFDM